MRVNLDYYVYRNLQKYGNCYIGTDIYRKMGEKKILSELRKKGYECEITAVKTNHLNNQNIKVIDLDYIIELKHK